MLQPENYNRIFTLRAQTLEHFSKACLDAKLLVSLTEATQVLRQLFYNRVLLYCDIRHNIVQDFR